MKLESLETLNDDELRAITARCEQLLLQHDRERKEKALEQARALLASVGLKMEDLVKAKIKPVGAHLYKGGRVYQHPTDKTLVWAAKGKKPSWLRELEAGGGSAIEVAANDNRTTSIPANDSVTPSRKSA
jgi:hypothetical protein